MSDEELEMTDEEMMALGVRGWALLCAAISSVRRDTRVDNIVSVARRFETYLRGEEA